MSVAKKRSFTWCAVVEREDDLTRQVVVVAAQREPKSDAEIDIDSDNSLAI